MSMNGQRKPITDPSPIRMADLARQHVQSLQLTWQEGRCVYSAKLGKLVPIKAVKDLITPELVEAARRTEEGELYRGMPNSCRACLRGAIDDCAARTAYALPGRPHG